MPTNPADLPPGSRSVEEPDEVAEDEERKRRDQSAASFLNETLWQMQEDWWAGESGTGADWEAVREKLSSMSAEEFPDVLAGPVDTMSDQPDSIPRVFDAPPDTIGPDIAGPAPAGPVDVLDPAANLPATDGDGDAQTGPGAGQEEPATDIRFPGDDSEPDLPDDSVDRPGDLLWPGDPDGRGDPDDPSDADLEIAHPGDAPVEAPDMYTEMDASEDGAGDNELTA